MAIKKEIDISSIEKLKKHLEKLPPKEPETKPIAAALEELKPVLVSAIERGYTREDLLEIANDKGIPVKAYHMKALFKKPTD